MHLRDELAYSYAEKAIQYMDKCEWYFAEVDLQQAQEEFRIEDFYLADEQSISDLLPERKYNRIQKHCKSILDFDITAYDRYLPLVLLNRIAEHILDKQKQMALDQYLWMKAFEMSRQLSGIETLSSQLELMRSMSTEEQLGIFVKAAGNLSKYARELKRLRKAYESQEILSLYKISKRSLGALKKSLIYDRNAVMANEIVRNNDRTAFYAVGAAHLAGNKGVLKYLKEKGVKLKAIH